MIRLRRIHQPPSILTTSSMPGTRKHIEDHGMHPAFLVVARDRSGTYAKELHDTLRAKRLPPIMIPTPPRLQQDHPKTYLLLNCHPILTYRK